MCEKVRFCVCRKGIVLQEWSEKDDLIRVSIAVVKHQNLDLERKGYFTLISI